ncbi:hypothetical protein AB0A05_27200 [Streptomyces sp. NPDC046374]|uniref:hypothetical protein n=1 Tax=Streptomyces sp. NPDC046374 TaxID=3154917 RepID=UPI0033F4494B
MASKTTVDRVHAWKGEGGVAWVYDEPGRYVARVRLQRWDLERHVRNPFAGRDVTGWYLSGPGTRAEFVGPSMRPAVDAASAKVTEHNEQRKLKGSVA